VKVANRSGPGLAWPDQKTTCGYVMKILLVITRGDVGGAQTSVLNLAKAFRAKGHEVTVGLNNERFLRQALQESGIQAKIFKHLKRTYNPVDNFLFVMEFLHFINKNAFNIIHFNSSNSLFGALGAKVSRAKPKTVFTFRGLSLLDGNYQGSASLKGAYGPVFKMLLKCIDQPVFVCQENYRAAIKNNLTKNGTVIYNGLDPAEITFLSARQARDSLQSQLNTDLEGKLVIGSIGRLADQKNYPFLINMFPKILAMRPDARGVIIGDGPEREKLPKLISELDLANKIFLAGEVEYAYRYMRAFDVFVLPSLYEGFSITLIEALFAGLPILASNVGGNPELLDFSDPQLFQLHDENDFLTKFDHITRNQSTRKKLGGRNKALGLKYQSETMAEEYLNIYKELMASI